MKDLGVAAPAPAPPQRGRASRPRAPTGHEDPPGAAVCEDPRWRMYRRQRPEEEGSAPPSREATSSRESRSTTPVRPRQPYRDFRPLGNHRPLSKPSRGRSTTRSRRSLELPSLRSRSSASTRRRSVSSSGSVRSSGSVSSFSTIGSAKSLGLSASQAREFSTNHQRHRQKLRAVTPTLRFDEPGRLRRTNSSRATFEAKEARLRIDRQNRKHLARLETIRRKPGQVSYRLGDAPRAPPNRRLAPNKRPQPLRGRHGGLRLDANVPLSQFSTLLPAIEASFAMPRPPAPVIALPRHQKNRRKNSLLTSRRTVRRIYTKAHPTLEAKRRMERTLLPNLLPDFESVTALYARIAAHNDESSMVSTLSGAISPQASLIQPSNDHPPV